MSLSLPEPQGIDPASVPALNWGVVGTGRIARSFVSAVQAHTTQQVRAVVARDARRTQVFAVELGIEKTYTDLDALLEDPAIDAVYVATPHTTHVDIALRAIAAGRHVLVEKPLATTGPDAERVTRAGRKAGVLVMEAMWTRYLPQSEIVRALLGDGAIGDVHMVTADFGFAAAYDPASRLWDPALGGGALLDAGVYPVSFASSVLGPIAEVSASGVRGATGVDERATVRMTTAGGVEALVATSIVSSLPTRATISGSAGRIEMLAPFFCPSGVALIRGSLGGEQRTEWRDDRFAEPHDGLSDEAIAFASYVGEGRTESPIHTHQETVEVLNLLDEARDQIR